MLSCFAFLRELSLLSVIVRMLIAFLCGSLIGWERTAKRRPAGFRTHILICLGAMITTMTSQYIGAYTEFSTDISRLGAQVISGVGFIGAGTIIVTRAERIKGLTTAAGLWALAIVGLCIGAGFIELALLTTAVILFVECVFLRWEHLILNHAPAIHLYLEYGEKKSLDALIDLCEAKDVKVGSMVVTRRISDDHDACLIIEVRLKRGDSIDDLMREFKMIDCMHVVEQL